jgi:dihydrofolate reductase
MRKLIVFDQISLDGRFTDAHGDMSWAHRSDPEWNEFVAGNAAGGGMLLFGRVTYEMMMSFWPTPAAFEAMPVVAKQMNDLPKVVFSRTLAKATWKNTRLVKGDLPAEVRKLKAESAQDLAIMGSGSIVAQLAPLGLVDEYQLVVNPIALGNGRTMFDGIPSHLRFGLHGTRTFRNGNVLLTYRPA